ncbi:MAG: GyrI-like domain-containing protein [Phycisphaerae bacterium]
MTARSASRKKGVRKSRKLTVAAKLDLYKEHTEEYVTPKKPVLVDVKPARYLSIVGRGEPGGEAFQAKIGALFAVAFTIKMTRKFAGRDYKVCAPEGLWWSSGGRLDFFREPRDQWNWNLMIRTPEFITDDDLAEALEKLKAKGKGPEVAEVKLVTIEEGRCVQMLHVGRYDREPETVAQMKAFAKENGLFFHGLHHEIYLSDPRRVAPERLRTILRQPVR